MSCRPAKASSKVEDGQAERGKQQVPSANRRTSNGNNPATFKDEKESLQGLTTTPLSHQCQQSSRRHCEGGGLSEGISEQNLTRTCLGSNEECFDAVQMQSAARVWLALEMRMQIVEQAHPNCERKAFKASKICTPKYVGIEATSRQKLLLARCLTTVIVAC